MDEIPPEFADIAATKREELLDAAASFDDELMEKYLDGARTSPSRSSRLLCARVSMANELNPRLRGLRLQEQGRPGAARRCRRLPAQPARRRGRQGYRPGHRARRSSVILPIDEPFSALAFKIMTDPFVGKLSLRPRLLRPRRVRLLRGSTLPRVSSERIGRILADARQPSVRTVDDAARRRHRRLRRPQEHHHR